MSLKRNTDVGLVPLEARQEAKIWVQVVSLASDLRKYTQEENEVSTAYYWQVTAVVNWMELIPAENLWELEQELTNSVPWLLLHCKGRFE